MPNHEQHAQPHEPQLPEFAPLDSVHDGLPLPQLPPRPQRPRPSGAFPPRPRLNALPRIDCVSFVAPAPETGEDTVW